MFVSVYLDDVHFFHIYLKSINFTSRHTKTVGLKLNPTKCHFVHTHVCYPGHVIIAEGVKPTTSQIEVIQEFAAPKDVKALREFLGLASFYRKFVPS